MGKLKTFFLTPTDRVQVGLRRYQSPSEEKCPGPGMSYHNAEVVVDVEPYEGKASTSFQAEYKGDERWPTHCACGYEFAEDDKWQVNRRLLHARSDDGPGTTLPDAPPGAMWDATWMGRKGLDGRSLIVKCPNGVEWWIDGRASNCTKPDDDGHRCWVRSGEPPDITAGKSGNTCAAGAGSIQAGDYHGFLRNGEFT